MTAFAGQKFLQACPTLTEFVERAPDLFCRFCGSTDLRVDGKFENYRIACPDCGAHGPVARTGWRAAVAYRDNVAQGPNTGPAENR